ncbi:MAG: hypothetical protein WB523_20450 [Candidatus Sulfotelmatobacter sp.]
MKTTPAPAPTPTPAQPSYPSTPADPITWSAGSSKLPAPTAEDPANSDWGTGSTDFPLTVSSPSAGASVTSPINVVASTTPTNPIFFMRVYVDNVSVYYTSSNSINTQIFAAPGQHTVLVMAEELNCAALPCSSGLISATPISITVTSQAQTAISSIQNTKGWQSCSAVFPAGVQRAGQLCAAGESQYVPTSMMTMGVSPPAPAPAMDGKSAQFSISPGTVAQSPSDYGYSNYLYFNPIAGGNSVTTFTYDLYFWIDNVDAPQALEFDVNQGYDDTTANGGSGAPQRFVWGSECNFKGDSPPGQWDIWDDSLGVWTPTGISCKPNVDILPNTWNHLTWNLHQMGGMVYYDTLTVNGVATPVNQVFVNQSGWTLEEIDTAFQMDLAQPPVAYNVWLDQVSLTAQ